MRGGRICPRGVVFCAPVASVAEVAPLIHNVHVGDVVVAKRRGGNLIPVGILTDRDLVVEVLAAGVERGRWWRETSLPRTCRRKRIGGRVRSDRPHACEGAVRRPPVFDAGGFLIGALSAEDVTEFLAPELTDVAHIVPRPMRLEQAGLPPLRG